MSDHTHLVHSFSRGDDEAILLAIRSYKGQYYIDIRTWFKAEGGGGLRPTRRGVFFAVQHAEELVKGIEKLTRELARLKPLKDDSPAEDRSSDEAGESLRV